MKAEIINHISELVLEIKNNCHEKDKEIAKKFGITNPELSCISVFFFGDSFSVKEMAGKMCMTSGGITRIVTSLEEKEYIMREMAPNDRRGIIVSLTNKGKKLITDLQNASSEFFKSVLADLSTAQQDSLISNLNILANAWKKNE